MIRGFQQDASWFKVRWRVEMRRVRSEGSGWHGGPRGEVALCRRLQRAKREGDLPKNSDPAELAHYVMTVLREWRSSQPAAPVAINYVESRKSHCARGRNVSLNATVPTPSTKQTSGLDHVC